MLNYHQNIIPNYPQSFTGKERDSETGFSYFGARYYDSDILTGWLSVDPMADKYPGLSPYAYCAWNPVRLVDPDGREISASDDFYKDEKGQIKWDLSISKETTLKEGEEYLGKISTIIRTQIVTCSRKIVIYHSSIRVHQLHWIPSTISIRRQARILIRHRIYTKPTRH